MNNKNKYRHGDHNVICDYSGFKVKASECRMTWDGFFVRKDLWEPRHPQDFLKARGDKQSVDIARPEKTDSFLATNDVTADSF